MKGRTLTLDKLIALTKTLTGKDLTPEEIQRARARWEVRSAMFAKATQTAAISDTSEGPAKYGIGDNRVTPE